MAVALRHTAAAVGVEAQAAEDRPGPGCTVVAEVGADAAQARASETDEVAGVADTGSTLIQLLIFNVTRCGQENITIAFQF